MSQSSVSPAPRPTGGALASAPPSPATGTITALAERPVASVPEASATAGSTPARRRRTTPQLLRSLTTALTLVGLLFGISAVISFAGLAVALNRAQAETAQLIRVQQIETLLLSADATATNAFLVGGLEPPTQRASYDQAILRSGHLIAEAAQAQPADAKALAVLNQDVVNYATAIEQARANNRQGFPVGAQYLRNASASLRSGALAILDLLVEANADRTRAAMGSSVWLVFPIVGLLALAATTATMIWVALRFRRRINPGLVGATAVLLVAWVVGLVVLTQVTGTVRGIRDDAFASVNDVAAVRIEANNAKANESLTLISRGSGGAFEQAWSDSAKSIDRQISRLQGPDLVTPWTAYKSTHRQIRSLDGAGSWDAAVRLATGSNATSSNAKFAAFDQQATRSLNEASQATSVGLAAPKPLLIVFAVLVFLAGLAAALLARAGLAARIQEYR